MFYIPQTTHYPPEFFEWIKGVSPLANIHSLYADWLEMKERQRFQEFLSFAKFTPEQSEKFDETVRGIEIRFYEVMKRKTA